MERVHVRTDEDVKSVPKDVRSVVLSCLNRDVLKDLRRFEKLEYLRIEVRKGSNLFSVESSELIAQLPAVRALQLVIADNERDLSYTDLTDLKAEHIPAKGCFLELTELTIGPGLMADESFPKALSLLPKLRAFECGYLRESVSDDALLAAFPKNSRLERLCIGRVRVRDEGIPGVSERLGKQLAELPNLQVLDLWGLIETRAFRRICQSQSLIHFDFAGCALKDVSEIADLSNLKSLQSIKAETGGRQDLDDIVNAIAGLPHLEEVELKGYWDDGGPGVGAHLNLSYEGFEKLCNVPSLKVLQLSYGAVFNISTKPLRLAKNLEALRMTADDATAADIATCSKLERLSLGFNVTMSDAGLASLASLQSLRMLDLGHGAVDGAWGGKHSDKYKVSGKGVEAIVKGCQKLEVLFLYNIPKVSESLCRVIAPHSQLTYVGFEFCGPDIEGLEALAESKSISFLSIDEFSKDPGRFSKALGKMKALAVVELQLVAQDRSGAEELIKAHPKIRFIVRPF